MADEPKPWTIRGVSPEIRNAFVAAAEREGEAIGQWFNRVGREMVASDRRRTRQPATAETLASSPSDTSDSAQTSLAELAGVARQLAETPGAPAALQRLAFGVIRDRLRAERGNGRAPVSDKLAGSV